MKTSMPATELPLKLLLLGTSPSALPEALEGLGCTVLALDACHRLVQSALEPQPQALLLIPPANAPNELDDWLDALAPLAARLPGVCIAPAASSTQRRRGFELGLQVWLEAPLPAEPLLAQLQWAAWQAQRLGALQTQLDERKWTDKAKGLLMAAQDLDEASAYQLLRDAAMHAHIRLGEVSRSVVRAAQAAEAVNLAGQQRMLSQRIVKLLAQRAAGIEARRAKVLQDESCARVEANLARLASLLATTEHRHEDLLVALGKAWHRLRSLLVGKPTAAVLTQADVAADRLLDLSEQLTSAIESGGAGRPLRVVNLCGRQRMLSQRLAKEALLADLLPGHGSGQIGAGLSAFEAGLLELEAAPLSSAEIRASLAAVREEWLRLLRSLRELQGSEAAAGLARSSELLLSRLDQLTVQYQQSLQLILG